MTIPTIPVSGNNCLTMYRVFNAIDVALYAPELAKSRDLNHCNAFKDVTIITGWLIVGAKIDPRAITQSSVLNLYRFIDKTVALMREQIDDEMTKYAVAIYCLVTAFPNLCCREQLIAYADHFDIKCLSNVEFKVFNRLQQVLVK